MGIRITPGTTPQAHAELTAYIQAYLIGSTTFPGIYWTPDPTDAAMLLDMTENAAELIPMDVFMNMVMAA